MIALLAALIGPLFLSFPAEIASELRKASPVEQLEILSELPERMMGKSARDRAGIAPMLLALLNDEEKERLHPSLLTPLLRTETGGGCAAVLRLAYARESGFLRDLARTSLARDTSAFTTGALVKNLARDRSPRARAWILLLLGSRGKHSAGACGAICDALRDSSPMVRGAAVEALVRIRGESLGYDAAAWKARVDEDPLGPLSRAAVPAAPPEKPAGDGEEPVTQASPAKPPEPGRLLSLLAPRYFGIPLDRGMVVVVLDFSGSVRGAGGKEAQAELIRCLSLLPSDRAFTVVAFDERILRLTSKPESAVPDHKEALVEFLKRLPPGKRTELLLPLHLGVALAGEAEGGDAQVLVVSDGAPTAGGPPLRETVDRMLRALGSGVRFDAAVLGGDVSLFRYLAGESGGRTVVIPR